MDLAEHQRLCEEEKRLRVKLLNSCEKALNAAELALQDENMTEAERQFMCDAVEYIHQQLTMLNETPIAGQAH